MALDREHAIAHPDGNAARGMRRANRATALTLATQYLADLRTDFPTYGDWVDEATDLAERLLPWLDADIPGGAG